jgi:hypothetical protein
MSYYMTRGSRVFAPSGGGEKVAAYARGRRCAIDGCATILSTYNPSSCCALHEQQHVVRRHQRTTRPSEERVCPQCGCEFETTNPQRRFCSDRCRMAAFQRRRRTAGAAGAVRPQAG